MRDVLLGILIGAAGAAALTRRRKLKHRGGGDWYPGKNPPVDGSCILPFEYMEAFMLAVFEGLGVPAKEAKICADVLIEADKRGIDSHGIGRLKPIYCDRVDQGILKPIAPITIVQETPASALVDGNLGLGLYVGPYCMDLAIKKAKEVRRRRRYCPEIHPLWDRGLLRDDGHQTRLCRILDDERETIHRADVRRRGHARDESFVFRDSHR